MSVPEFKPWDSIPRLKRDCVVTEKIDGTNAVVHFDDEGKVWAGSRNRWLTVDDDNMGFARWVGHHAEELRALGPGYHYGEWWGLGIQRRYGLTEKRFSLFNSARWGEGGPDEHSRPPCCHVVPVLYRGPFSSEAVEDALARLRDHGSVAAAGFMRPEKVVVYMAAARKLFKVTLDGDGHKSAGAS